MPLERAFYERDAREVARELIGKRLVRREPDGRRCAGLIVETEAYLGAADPASHAYRGPTPRNRSMFGPAGVAYVYRSYGIHFCLNAVTGPEGEASAVLIRALAPDEGLPAMKERRGRALERELASGPGKLCQALGLDLSFDGASLAGPALWIEDAGVSLALGCSARVGISVAREAPWRWFALGHPAVSRGRPSRPSGR